MLLNANTIQTHTEHVFFKKLNYTFRNKRRKQQQNLFFTENSQIRMLIIILPRTSMYSICLNFYHSLFLSGTTKINNLFSSLFFSFDLLFCSQKCCRVVNSNKWKSIPWTLSNIQGFFFRCLLARLKIRLFFLFFLNGFLFITCLFVIFNIHRSSNAYTFPITILIDFILLSK